MTVNGYRLLKTSKITFLNLLYYCQNIWKQIYCDNIRLMNILNEMDIWYNQHFIYWFYYDQLLIHIYSMQKLFYIIDILFIIYY